MSRTWKVTLKKYLINMDTRKMKRPYKRKFNSNLSWKRMGSKWLLILKEDSENLILRVKMMMMIMMMKMKMNRIIKGN
jgi:hypothetical protein